MRDSASRLVMLSSLTPVRFAGGPKPWLLDGTRYYAALTALDSPETQKHSLKIERRADTFTVTCPNMKMFAS